MGSTPILASSIPVDQRIAADLRGQSILPTQPVCHVLIPYFLGVETTVTTDMGRECTDVLAAHGAGFKVARLSFACVIKALRIQCYEQGLLTLLCQFCLYV